MGTLVSINVGLPQDVEWQGIVIRTAIWKRPVAGRVTARHLNIDGDGQGDLAGHGGEHRAVMVYQLDSYRYWQHFLQREDFEHGQFGENLTVDGLADAEVCVGDRYRIGGAVFEVTQPRVTCYRVGLRMNNPSMPALLVSHKRPGFYMRVMQEGEIGAGDEITKVADGPEHVTVAEVDALLYLPGHPRDRLEHALRIPALSAGWKQSLKALADADPEGGNAGLAAPSAHLAWPGFRSMRVREVQRESADVLSFILEAEDQSLLAPALPGQFLAVKMHTGTISAPLIRSYSMSGPSGAQGGGMYRISVKRASGPGSQYMHDQVKAGALLQVSAPRGNFTLGTSGGPVVLLSAGIGATPVLSILHALSSTPDQSQREVWWCYGARNRREHPFAAEVRLLLTKLQRGHAVVAYSKPEEAEVLGKDYDFAGRLNLLLLQQHAVPREADFYLCGPAAFLSELSASLLSWGVPAASIHTETFGASSALTPGIASAAPKAPHQPVGNPGTGPMVSFTRSGLTAAWNPRFSSLLEFAEACDIPVRWSCRVGVCHTCESGIIGGKVHYAPEPLDNPLSGNLLLCCATPLSEIELDL